VRDGAAGGAVAAEAGGRGGDRGAGLLGKITPAQFEVALRHMCGNCFIVTGTERPDDLTPAQLLALLTHKWERRALDADQVEVDFELEKVNLLKENAETLEEIIAGAADADGEDQYRPPSDEELAMLEHCRNLWRQLELDASTSKKPPLTSTLNSYPPTRRARGSCDIASASFLDLPWILDALIEAVDDVLPGCFMELAADDDMQGAFRLRLMLIAMRDQLAALLRAEVVELALALKKEGILLPVR